MEANKYPRCVLTLTVSLFKTGSKIREIGFPFSNHSNYWPTISAWSLVHEMLSQEFQQQGRGDSPTTVVRSLMAANFYFFAYTDVSTRAVRLLLVTTFVDSS